MGCTMDKHAASGGKGYTLHVHTAAGGKKYILHVHKRTLMTRETRKRGEKFINVRTFI
jgi:hypothetical protein